MKAKRSMKTLRLSIALLLLSSCMSWAQSQPDYEPTTHVDRELFPEAYGILTSDRLMFPVDVADWPVKIDNSHQLFVDDYLIASMTNLTREIHQPAKDPRNPLVTTDKPWEKIAIIVQFVLRDAASGKFRMWYSTRLHYTEPGGARVRFPTLYAESDDGIIWHKPDLELLEYEGSKENNFVIHGGRITGLFENPEASNPDERFTALVLHEPDYVKREGYYLYKSPDGLRWKGDLENCIIPSLQDYSLPQGGIADTTIFRYDRLLQRYICSAKFVLSNDKLGRMRCRGQAESDDLIHWSRPRFTLYPDDNDEPDTQIYGHIGFPYENMWLGLLRVMHTDRAGYKQVEIELSMSRDGMTWSRPSNRQAFLPFGDDDSWDPDYTDSAHNGPLLVGDELWFYYRGSRHQSRDNTEGWKYSSMETGLAVLRRDGFVSLNAGKEPGTVMTRPLSFSGRALFVNAEVREGGWIKTAILSKDNEAIPNCSFEDSKPILAGGTEIPVQWKHFSQLDLPPGKHVRIAFELRNAKIYSFWNQCADVPQM